MTDSKFNKIRIASLKKWRREICDEFEKWPSMYKNEWFINQMFEIDTLINKLEGTPPPLRLIVFVKP